MSQTTAYLKEYIHERNLDTRVMQAHPIFYNRIRGKLTRAGIAYILERYIESARIFAPEHIPDTVSPHCTRLSKVMHILQAGVSLVYIRDLLGHVDTKTTEIYARADTDMKRKALKNAYKNVTPGEVPEWQNGGKFMLWLQNLCRSN